MEGYKYVNFDIEKIQDFPEILSEFKTILKGCNVTIPYKESVFNYLDEVDTIASEIGAVNTIKFTNDGRLVGYNTDVVGFEKISSTTQTAPTQNSNLSSVSVPFLYFFLFL